MHPSGLNNGFPSPPETYYGAGTARSAAPRPGSSFDNAPTTMETPPSRFRRGSSMGYHSPGHRESRERLGSLASKFLVIVVPPPSVVREHGCLGHTLSTGPAHRLSQGLVMPLFPTMYGQLTAVAREFNFPSAVGLCLYYCHAEQGMTMAPRLSDDVWPTIWGFADPAIGEKRSPVLGKLEFDIDTTQARWYPAWLASSRRESNEYPLYNSPITAPALQFRGDNRFSFPRTTLEDGFADQLIQQRSAPVITRHVPRKLSLVERFDVPQPEMKERQSNSPPTGLPLSSHILSPITQQEEPKSARLHMNDRVQSWRATTITNPPGEISLEPGAVEIVASLEASSSASQSSFHLEDYAFSISTAGPDDSTSVASDHQDYLPSVHLCDRLNGSVCMTASHCTSPGPSDYEISFEQDEDMRLPSPDIAHCMFEDSPLTPITATSWGPPSPGSVGFFSDSYTSPSFDLGSRMCFSRPSTPSTATSWGPQSFDGLSTTSSHQTTFSVHLCDRGEFSIPSTPQIATSWGPPSPPFGSKQISLSSPSHTTPPLPNCSQYPFFMLYPPVYPTFALYPSAGGEAAPRADEKDVAQLPPAVGLSYAGYPSSILYPPVYPHFDLYSSISGGNMGALTEGISAGTRSLPLSATSGYPSFILYPSVYPYNLNEIYPGVALEPSRIKHNVQTSCSDHSMSQHPNFCLCNVDSHSSRSPVQVFTDRPVYPHNLTNIYLSVDKALERGLEMVETSHSAPVHFQKAGLLSGRAKYPYFDLYPAVYPLFNLYPELIGLKTPPEPNRQTESTSDSVSTNNYPSLVIYSPQYPYFDLYPAPAAFNICSPNVTGVATKRSSVTTRPPAHYPYFDLYPAVYPHFSIWPSSPALATFPRSRTHDNQRSVRSSKLTHSELHAMVMMEKGSTLAEGLKPTNPSLPTFLQPSTRPIMIKEQSRFRPSSPPPSTPSRSPTSTLRRSAQGNADNHRASLYPPGLVRAQDNIMSTRDNRPPVSRRMTIWDNGNVTAPPSVPTIKAVARRDSLVIQHIKAFNSRP